MVRAPCPSTVSGQREVRAHSQKRGLHQTPRQHMGSQLHSDEEEMSTVYKLLGLGRWCEQLERTETALTGR